MSVQIGNNTNNANFASGAGRTEANTMNASPASSGGDALFDFAQGLHNIPVIAAQGSQSITDFLKVWEEMKATDGIWDMAMLSVDRTTEPGWFASMVVAAVWLKEDAARTNTPLRVAAYPMLLAGTEKRSLSSFMVKINDLEYPILEVPSMAMNDQYMTRVKELVTDHFNGREVAVQLVPGMVIPKEVDLTKPEQVRPLIANAARAGVTNIAQSMPKFIDADLSRLAPGSIQTMKIETNTVPRYDITGMPVRCDYLMTFSDRQPTQPSKPGQRERSLNDVGGAETVWATMSGFTDMTYFPTPQSLFNTNVDDNARTRVMVPRAVITEINHHKLATVASNMMMLATTTALASPNVWMGQLYQRFKNHSVQSEGKGKDKFDPTDIGVLNMLAKAFTANGEVAPYDLKSNDSSPEEFIKFANRVFVPTMHVAVAVPHAGPQSFFMGIISAAANNDASALKALVAHLDKLTGNTFSKKYFANGDASSLNASMFFSEVNNTGPLGYAYQKGPDDTLVKVDLRVVDYLYVANRFKNDPTTIKKFAQSFLVGEIDAARRMGQRMDVLNACFTNVVVNGYYEMHTFRPELLTTIFNCMVALGIKPELKFMDPLRDAASGDSAPAFVRQQGISTNMLTAGGFAAAGGMQSGGLGTGGLGGIGGGSMGRWA